MDPNWIECPYCRAERSVRVRTTGFKTRVDHSADPEHAGGDEARRITGVLVTFTWRREGQLFPLYEGKNRIGSGRAADRRCDVQISTDPTLSREHALIRCLGDDYEIFDQKSENGTYMNGERVPVHGMPLEDGARIKTGATIWTFQMIRVPGVSAVGVSERRARESRNEDSALATGATDDAEAGSSPVEPRHPTIVENEESSSEGADTAVIEPDGTSTGARTSPVEPRHPTIVENEESSSEGADTAVIEPDGTSTATSVDVSRDEEVSRSEEVSHRHKHKTVVLGTAEPPPPPKNRPTRFY
jgi:pSer/pThr/pTyr-binding forkhead associated (FHA) protein